MDNFNNSGNPYNTPYGDGANQNGGQYSSQQAPYNSAGFNPNINEKMNEVGAQGNQYGGAQGNPYDATQAPYSASPQGAGYGLYGNGPMTNQDTTLGILGLGCSILGILFGCCCCGIGFLLSVAGIILGIFALKREPRSHGFAIAAIAFGAIGVVIAGVIIIISVTGTLASALESY